MPFWSTSSSDRKRVDLVLYGNPQSGIQVALNPCEHQISVGTAGPQLRVPDSSGHCRTSIANSRSQWTLPGVNRKLQISVGMPERLSKSNQNKRQTTCCIECHIDCDMGCEIEYRNICQTGCQKKCQFVCPKKTATCNAKIFMPQKKMMPNMMPK